MTVEWNVILEQLQDERELYATSQKPKGRDPVVRIEVHHFFHADPEVEGQLNRIEKGMRRVEEDLHRMREFLVQILSREAQQMALLEGIAQEVHDTSGVMESAVVFIEGLEAKLNDALAIGDPAELKARVAELTGELGSNRTRLAASIANNPSPPPPSGLSSSGNYPTG